MLRIYIIALVGVICVGAYFSGRAVGHASGLRDCSAGTTTKYIQTIKQSEIINAETNHTAVRDIRRILREKYTIVE